ncbi:DUF4097 family beta strand repeat-containing protein [Streptomyces sp. SP17BM10]|uniref:DUF4097 family beta strand repeat-containing protein n=1 Tax=Streptomyces sp. SP17BM10 TaxID=3002530 RepID=UPI002E77BBB0|nr:DUF4097 family beta strand repeat-containing protein [Streptomyces sp. SP17BM10]MEE1787899.1 DUF4097 family beta strand repeat-containing protein [Streptomyces sp. SP17BM10]
MVDATGRVRPAGPRRGPGQAATWRIIGSLSLAFVLVMGASQTLGLVARQQTTAEKTYDHVVVRKLQLATGSASVRVRAGEDGRVVVRRNLNYTFRAPRFSTVIEGDVLSVAVSCRQPLPFLGCGAEIELDVPQGTEVSGSVDSGSVDVADLSGEVRLDATSGALYLRRLSGEVRARTTSGMVEGTELTAARVEASTTSGSVELDFVRAPHAVDVSTSSGSATMTLPKGSRYAFSGQVGSGSRSIDPDLADASSPDSLHASVTSGSLRIGYRGDGSSG